MRPSSLISSLELHLFPVFRSKLLGGLLLAFFAAFLAGPIAAAEILDAKLVAATGAVDYAFTVPGRHRVSAELIPLGSPAHGSPEAGGAPGLAWLSGPCAGPAEMGATALCVLRVTFGPRHDGARFRLRLVASPPSTGPDEVDEDSSIGQLSPPPPPSGPDEVDEDS